MRQWIVIYSRASAKRLPVVSTRQHKPRWNPDLQQWFCSNCGRTSNHQGEVEARAELNAFECKIVGVQTREWTEEEIQKCRVAKKMKNKF